MSWGQNSSFPIDCTCTVHQDRAAGEKPPLILLNINELRIIAVPSFAARNAAAYIGRR